MSEAYQERRSADSVLKIFILIFLGIGFIAGVLSYLDGHFGQGWFSALVIVLAGIVFSILAITLIGGILWNIRAIRLNRKSQTNPAPLPVPAAPTNGMDAHWKEVNRLLAIESGRRESKARAIELAAKRERIRQSQEDRQTLAEIRNIENDAARSRAFLEFKRKQYLRLTGKFK